MAAKIKEGKLTSTRIFDTDMRRMKMISVVENRPVAECIGMLIDKVESHYPHLNNLTTPNIPVTLDRISEK